MVEYIPSLHELCFPFLDKPEALELLNAMESFEIQGGTTLYKTADIADCLYVLVSGKIAVQKQTGFGGRMQVVALLDPGAPLGESGLLDIRSRRATLVAVANSCLLSLSREAFADLSARTPALAIKVLKWLMGKIVLRLEKSSERLVHVL